MARTAKTLSAQIPEEQFEPTSGTLGDELDTSHRIAESLHKAIEALETRLTNVLIPGDPLGYDGMMSDVDKEQMSSARSSVSQLNSVLDEAIHRLEQLNRRVDV